MRINTNLGYGSDKSDQAPYTNAAPHRTTTFCWYQQVNKVSGGLSVKLSYGIFTSAEEYAMVLKRWIEGSANIRDKPLSPLPPPPISSPSRRSPRTHRRIESCL